MNTANERYIIAKAAYFLKLNSCRSQQKIGSESWSRYQDIISNFTTPMDWQTSQAFWKKVEELFEKTSDFNWRENWTKFAKQITN